MSEITQSLVDRIIYFGELLNPERAEDVNVVSRAPLFEQYDKQKTKILRLETGQHGGDMPAEVCHYGHVKGQLIVSLDMLRRSSKHSREFLLEATRNLMAVDLYTRLLTLKDNFRKGEFKEESNVGMGAKGFFPDITDEIRKNLENKTGLASLYGESQVYILKAAGKLLNPSGLKDAVKTEQLMKETAKPEELAKPDQIELPIITLPSIKNTARFRKFE